MVEPEPKMISNKDFDKDAVNTKNIIKKVPTTNRGPKSKSPSPDPASQVVSINESVA